MSLLRIEGGYPLNGELRAAGNKNAVLPMMAAALLTRQEVVLSNVPDIGDVHTMSALLRKLGVKVRWEKHRRRLCICAAELTDNPDLPRTECSRIRGSILLAAPFLSRKGRVSLYPPGGDVIGMRRLDTHFYGLEKLGAHLETSDRLTVCAEKPLSGTDMFLSEASVTATEQILIAAAAARGTTVIRNAACEPHVRDLGELLQKMGARIEGLGTNIVEVTGADGFCGAQHEVVPDHTEAGSYLALAAATGGKIRVDGIIRSHFWMVRRVFERLGTDLELVDDAAIVDGTSRGAVKPAYSGGIPMIDDGIWPQFPSDLMSVMVVLATQVPGTILFFEKMYESRLYFVDRLNAMGANTVVCDPHRVVVCGPSQLHGIELASPDIRAGMALVGAALCAEGTSIIRNVNCIDRGYEDITCRLQALGARVERLDDNDIDNAATGGKG